MFRQILVPLDGSRRAEHAIPIAAQIAQVQHGSLVLLTSRERTKDVSPRGRYTGKERFCDA